jgi:hypothetical protein
MPKQTSVNLDITNNPDGFDISGGTTARKLAVTGGNVTFVGGNATYTLPSGNTTLIGGNAIVESLNGLTGARTLTGDGGAIIGASNNIIRARNTADGQTGVASFNTTHFSVSSTTGHVSLAAAYTVTGNTVITVAGSGIGVDLNGKTVTLYNIGVTGISAGHTGVSLIGTTGNVRVFNMGVHTFNGQTGHIAFGITGAGGAVTVTGPASNLVVDARLANQSSESPMTPGSTGVAAFYYEHFLVDQFGLVKLVGEPGGGGGGGSECSQYTNQIDCQNADCFWCTTYCSDNQFCSPWFSLYSGIGASSASDGSLAYLYLDVGNLSAASADVGASDNLIFFDADGTGLIKTKKASVRKVLLDTSADVFGTKSNNQIIVDKDSTKINYNVILGAVAAGQEGLVKGASAFSYITQNTVASINGKTGPVDCIAVTCDAQSFSGLQTFVSGISAANLLVSGGATFNSPITTNGYRYGASSFETKTAGFTLAAGDSGKVFVMANTVNETVAIPVGLPVGFACEFLVTEARVDVEAVNGVALLSASERNVQYTRFQLISYAQDSFFHSLSVV